MELTVANNNTLSEIESIKIELLPVTKSTVKLNLRLITLQNKSLKIENFVSETIFTHKSARSFKRLIEALTNRTNKMIWKISEEGECDEQRSLKLLGYNL